MLLKWQELSLFSCLAYVVHVSLPYNTGIVLYHLGLYCQFGVGPHSWSEASKCCGCLPNHLINLSVQGEVVGDGGAKICELFNDIELIVR